MGMPWARRTTPEEHARRVEEAKARLAERLAAEAMKPKRRAKAKRRARSRAR